MSGSPSRREGHLLMENSISQIQADVSSMRGKYKAAVMNRSDSVSPVFSPGDSPPGGEGHAVATHGNMSAMVHKTTKAHELRMEKERRKGEKEEAKRRKKLEAEERKERKIREREAMKNKKESVKRAKAAKQQERERQRCASRNACLLRCVASCVVLLACFLA